MLIIFCDTTAQIGPKALHFLGLYTTYTHTHTHTTHTNTPHTHTTHTNTPHTYTHHTHTPHTHTTHTHKHTPHTPSSPHSKRCRNTSLTDQAHIHPGTWCRSWLGRVRFPMGSLGFFRLNPSGCTTALGSAQPLTEMCISLGGKGGRCEGLTFTSPCASRSEILEASISW